MSYEIVYDKVNFKVNDKIFPLIQSGSNNCFEHDGRPEKNWFIFPVIADETILSTPEEIKEKLNKIFLNSSEAPHKSRYTYFESIDVFKQWIMAGVKNAITVEEFVKYNHFDYFIAKYIDYKTGYKTYESGSIKTTEDLFEAIKKYSFYRKEDNQIQFKVDIPRDRRKPARQKRRKEVKTIDSFYVLETSAGYFNKLTKRGYKYSYSTNNAKIFKTYKEAERYLEKYKNRIDAKIIFVNEKTNILE